MLVPGWLTICSSDVVPLVMDSRIGSRKSAGTALYWLSSVAVDLSSMRQWRASRFRFASARDMNDGITAVRSSRSSQSATELCRLVYVVMLTACRPSF